tara:strand:- start:43 stop:1374 length:1332 start_codon:yes stop_codon:yes gene_type:complete
MRIKIKEKDLFKKIIKRNFNSEIKNIDSICLDSRLLEKNDIFLPIRGKKFDPHNFLPDILKKNPALVFSEKKINDERVVLINSSKNTLLKLAKEWMSFFNIPIIAITGSNGKTTTKEMLVEIFKSKYKINYSKGNYNSLIGLPVNVFEFSLDADYTIVEMGASKPNEINELCKIIKPNFSLITNIHEAHIGNFNSFDDLVKTKTAIFKNTDINGLIFENFDDINIKNFCKKIKNRISFSFKNKNVDFYGLWKNEQGKNIFYINDQRIYNQNINEIMAKNIIACYAIASSKGISHNQIIDAIKRFAFLQGRGQIIKRNGYLIIDDTYNANYESFKAGIKSFMKLSHKGRKILVIGDMKELGKKAKDSHIHLGNYINDKSPDIVYSFGELISYTSKQLFDSKINTRHFNKISKMIKDIKLNLIKGDAIYFKASRSLEFDKIINAL